MKSMKAGVPRATVLSVAIGLALGGCGGNSNDNNTAAASTPTILAASGCAGMAGVSLPNVTIQSAKDIAAGTVRPNGVTSGDYLPAHCVVTGVADPYIGTDGADHAIGFELRLPAGADSSCSRAAAATTACSPRLSAPIPARWLRLPAAPPMPSAAALR